MKKLGINILRLSDREVFENLNGVIERIYEGL
jgi:very-short-patch-repair endonuclease